MLQALKEVLFEFIGFITPFVFVAVIYYGLSILITAKKVREILGSLKK